MKPTILLMCTAIFATALPCLAADEKPAKPQPYVTLTGTDSHITESGCLLIRSESEWIKTWERHKGAKESKEYDLYFNPLALPTVDFEQCVVIAIFQGSTSNTAGLKADSLIVEKDRMVLRFESKTYQTADAAVITSSSGIPQAKVIEVQPEKPQHVYGFFIIPKTAKTIVVEEGSRSLLSEPMKFKERARFTGEK